MDALKEMFNRAYYERLAAALSMVYPAFPRKNFTAQVCDGLAERSLNQRMRHTSVVMHACLPGPYLINLDILKHVVPNMPGGYTTLVFPDYVAQYGLSHFNLSMEALAYFTTFGSSEFAVREFLKQDFTRAIGIMEKWSKHQNHHVRRLASEGSRPRLPWSFKLDAVLQEPSRTKKILENLKSDAELYVRKSVANHLNDLSKEHKNYMLRLVNTWDLENPHTAWIVKHASRNLIKKGDAAGLEIFKFEKNPKVQVSGLRLHKSRLRIGEALEFHVVLVSLKKQSQKLVVDYVIHYRKKLGELSPKVFKLKEFHLAPKAEVRLHKKQWLKDFTTRKHYAGKHRLDIQVNGKCMASCEFQLSV